MEYSSLNRFKFPALTLHWTQAWSPQWEGSVRSVSSASLPPSFMVINCSLSSAGARGGEGGLTGKCSYHPAWYYDVPFPGHWPLLGPSDCTLTPEAVLLVGHLLWPPKPVTAFCTHTAYMPVLTALCTAHPQSLSYWLVPLREAPFITQTLRDSQRSSQFNSPQECMEPLPLARHCSKYSDESSERNKGPCLQGICFLE